MRVLRLVLIAVVAAGCSEPVELLIASTTSTEDSGLFDVLLPAFAEAHPGYDVHVTAVGTGQALVLGRRKDADVLLVHAPAAESAFVAAGHGTARCEVMYNDFVIVGPPSDPAGIRGLDGAPAALSRIAASAEGSRDAAVEFVSRGDDSGTHRKEQALWSAAGVEPSGGWYMEVGQGMAESLRMAAEQRAYTLSDRATYVAQRDGLELDVLVEGDPRLFNQYGVIPVAGASHPEAARNFARWITGEAAQALIGAFGTERFGRPLFVPNAGECELAG
ncbi:MAG: substrate-binding domain-containing protein [Longimicrobiales bacterium]|nr:substrate-binding domain-containing protein [Longimicrobiales bacterium]